MISKPLISTISNHFNGLPLLNFFFYWSALDTVYLVIGLASTSGTPSASSSGSVYASASGPGALTQEGLLKNSFHIVYFSVLFLVLYPVVCLPAEPEVGIPLKFSRVFTRFIPRATPIPTPFPTPIPTLR